MKKQKIKKRIAKKSGFEIKQTQFPWDMCASIICLQSEKDWGEGFRKPQRECSNFKVSHITEKLVFNFLSSSLSAA